jgi:acyl-CoA synthetase (AMP-forming)/AMP-acid ligase II
MSVLPLVTLATLGAGATSVLPAGNAARPGRLEAVRIAAQVRAHAVEVLVASPAIAARIAACADRDGAFASLRRVYVGGAPVLPSLLDLWRRAAPSASIHALYGATEAEPIATLAAEEYGAAERRATRDGAGLLAGYAAPDTEVRILAPDVGAYAAGAARPPGLAIVPGAEGEIVVSGPQVVPGYLGEAGESAATFHAEGRRWLRTGDAGYFDREARLWLTGRCRDGVPAGAARIHPLRVEAALADDAAVRRAAFLESGGRRVVVVEPREPNAPLPFDRIADRVAFAAPQAIAVVRRIPLDARHAAKIDYRRLAAQFAAGRVRVIHRPAGGAANARAGSPP